MIGAEVVQIGSFPEGSRPAGRIEDRRLADRGFERSVFCDETSMREFAKKCYNSIEVLGCGGT